MKIGLYTWGSEGDVRPFVALAVGLSRAGHDVRLGYVAIDGKDYGPLGAPFGLAPRAVGADVVAAVRQKAAGAADDALAGRGNAMTQVRSVLEHFLDPVEDAMWKDASETVAGCDVVVVHLLHHPATAAALAHGIPVVTVQPAPVTPTRHLPPMGAPDLGVFNALSWWAGDLVGKRWFVPRFNRSRVRAGVPTIRQMFRRNDPDVALGLTCVSPTLVPRPADWDPPQRVPGFFELPARELGWTPPPALEAFLADGAPPLLMGFGSMLASPSDDTKHCVRVLVEAADRAGARALVQAPWETLGEMPRSPNVFRLGPAPHALVLSRCAGMVHHGGAGTTHTACRAGVPSIVVPFLGDQFFWGDRLHRHGVAPRPLLRRKLEVGPLAARITELLGTPAMKERATAMARAMAAEDGVAQAVAWIGELRR